MMSFEYDTEKDLIEDLDKNGAWPRYGIVVFATDSDVPVSQSASLSVSPSGCGAMQ